MKKDPLRRIFSLRCDTRNRAERITLRRHRIESSESQELLQFSSQSVRDNPDFHFKSDNSNRWRSRFSLLLPVIASPFPYEFFSTILSQKSPLSVAKCEKVWYNVDVMEKLSKTSLLLKREIDFSALFFCYARTEKAGNYSLLITAPNTSLL